MPQWKNAVADHRHSANATQAPPQTVLKPVELCLADEDDGVRDVLMRLLAALGPLKLEKEERDTVELVLAEVLNNIVEHAFLGMQSPGTIRLCAHMRSNGLHITVRDDGAPMPGGAAPLGMARDLDVDVQDLPEGGFGWFLIRDLAKDVHYRRKGGCNQLDLRLAVAIPQSH